MPPQVEGLPKSFYYINETTGQFHRAIIEQQPLSDVDAIIRSLAAESAVFFPRLCLVGNLPIHINMSNKLLTVLTRVPSIRMETYWQLRPASGAVPAYMSPIFSNETGRSVRLSPEWTPPANMGVFFCSHFENTRDGWRYSRSSLVVVCTDRGVTGTFKMPLPNIYPNGKLCLGNDERSIQPDLRIPVVETFGTAMRVFQHSPWNTDLLRENSGAVIDAMFRLNASDNVTWQPCPRNWHELLVRVNNTDFSSIPFHSVL